jgi:hypothetical protein
MPASAQPQLRCESSDLEKQKILPLPESFVSVDGDKELPLQEKVFKKL